MCPSCNEQDSCCPTRTDTNPSWWSSLIMHSKAKCFAFGDGVINLVGALYAIRDAIQAYTDQVTSKGYASALIEFIIPGGGNALTNGQVIQYQHAKSPFTYKVTGFGVSARSITAGGGSSSTDDIIHLKLWDYTTNAQIGNTLVLSVAQLFDKCTNSGNPIGENITAGHIYGIKMDYANTDSGSFAQPYIHAYIHVEPVELITEI